MGMESKRGSSEQPPASWLSFLMCKTGIITSARSASLAGWVAPCRTVGVGVGVGELRVAPAKSCLYIYNIYINNIHMLYVYTIYI